MPIKKLLISPNIDQDISSKDQIRILNQDYFRDFHQKKLSIATQNCIHFIDKDNIYYLKADGNYCMVFIEGRNKIIASKTLKHFANLLINNPFIRVHNSYLVNLTKIVAINKRGEMSLTLENGTDVPVSRRYREGLLEKLIKR